MPRERINLDVNNIVKKYKGGISEYELSKIFNVDRGTIRKRLIKQGVEIRSCKEASILRLSKMSFKEKQELTKKANEKMRAYKPSIQSQMKQAKTLQKTKGRKGSGEFEVCQALKKMGLNPIHQFAINKYNIDIGLFPIAVEIHITTTSPHKIPFVKNKIEYLTNHGWSILFIHVYSAIEITNIHIDYIFSYFHAVCANPALIGEYRVIGRRGELKPCSRLNFNKLPLIESFHN